MLSFVKRFSLFSLLFFFVVVGTGCSKRTVINGVEEKEANEILVLLSSKNIDGSKQMAEQGGAGANNARVFNIIVSQSDAIDAMALLNQYGFPRKKGESLLKIFSKQGLVPSDMEEKIRYQAGLQEQLSSVIRKIDGIIDADVQLSFPKEEALPGLNIEKKEEKVTASIYVKHQGILDDPNSHLVTKIRRLVASSINGLDFENVTLIPDKARFANYGIAGAGEGSGEDEKEYVKVWSVIVAKDSLSRFRALFFTLSTLVIVLAIALAWIIWKLMPFFLHNQGYQHLWHVGPFPFSKESTDETPEEAQEGEKETEEEPSS